MLVAETFARFPGCDGWIVRTGETYTYDTPFHIGNSPKGNPAADPCACSSATAGGCPVARGRFSRFPSPLRPGPPLHFPRSLHLLSR
eukprot:SAG22_NODE_1_length_62449_cov_158.689270_58_plen_87_part_00